MLGTRGTGSGTSDRDFYVRSGGEKGETNEEWVNPRLLGEI